MTSAKKSPSKSRSPTKSNLSQAYNSPMKKQLNSPKKSTPKKKTSKSSRPTYQRMVTETLKTVK